MPAARVLMALSHAGQRRAPAARQGTDRARASRCSATMPFGWRIMPALFGTLGLFAAMRGLWFASCSRFATIAGGILIATAFPLFVDEPDRDARHVHGQPGRWSRCGCSPARCAQNETGALPAGGGRRRARAGDGGEMERGAAGDAPRPRFLAVIRLRETGWRFLTAHRGAPVAGHPPVGSGALAGRGAAGDLLADLRPGDASTPPTRSPAIGMVQLTRHMVELQEEVVKPHPYQSVWYQWVFDWRAIWYLYEKVDGAQRGVLMLGNPLTMLLGLRRAGWCRGPWIYRGARAMRWRCSCSTRSRSAAGSSPTSRCSSITTTCCRARSCSARWRWRWIRCGSAGGRSYRCWCWPRARQCSPGSGRS